MLTHWLSGADAPVFSLDAVTGELQTQEPLDYETKDRYQVSVHVRDGKNADGTENTTETDATLALTITISNVNEAGLVELSPPMPREQQALTATLSDLDGLVAASILWEWARSADGTIWTPITAAAASGTAVATYTPQAVDVGHYVRATATYTDGHGMGQTEAATTPARVQAPPQVILVLSPSAITEPAGVSTVTATLTPAVSVETQVTVSATAVSPAMPGDFTLSGNTLTIRAHQTSSEGLVTLTAEDNDVDGPQETKQVTVTGTVPPTAPVTAPAAVTLTITDDDARGVTVTPTALTVNEGASRTYAVVLTSQPTAAVTVTLTAPANPAVTVDRTELVFQPGRWNTAQTVQVAAAQDTDADDEAATITHTVSGGDYAGETVAAVAVQVKDDEANGALRLVDADGPTDDAGRLEVFHNGEWGTVCDDRFDDAFDDASTSSPASVANSAPAFACQLLGYATGELVARDDIAAMSGAPESQPIWLDDVRCAAGSTHWTGVPPTQLHHCYHAGWGLHNCSHDEDVHLRCLGTAEQTEPPPPGDPLTAAFEALPTHHDGASVFTFRIAFSAEVAITWRAMKDHALTVTGGTVTKAKRVDGRSDLWEFTVAPAGAAPVSILVPQGRACSEPGALCTAAGQMLATGLGHSLPGPAPQEQPALTPLTARFVSVPAAHDGASAFWLELSFDAAVAQGSRRHIQALLSATAGTVAKVRRKDGQRDQWRIQVTPASADAVTVTLAASPACGATGAVCTPDGRTFPTALAVTVPGPVSASQGQPAVVTLTARVVSEPPPPEPVGALENPGPASFQSGIGLLSGWVCDAAVVELEINRGPRLVAASGTDRADTAPVCGDRTNGFGLLFNWNLLGDGVHTVVAVAGGVAFDQATFTVTTLGEELVTAGGGETVLADFPTPGEAVRLMWQQANQNFVLAPLDGGPPPASPPRPAGGPPGSLENPGPASFQSGIGLLSGWVCDAAVVELEINDGPRLAAAYGTDRADTAPVCGDRNNGFGLLLNWNLLGDGEHTVRALADGEEFGRATFTVTTLGVEFLQGTPGETLVADFPSPGEAVRLSWQQAQQNFVLAPLP